MDFKEVFTEKNKIKPNCPVKGIAEYWLIDKNTPSENVSLLLVNFDKNISGDMHRHNVEEIFYFIKGSGEIIVGEKKQDIKPGLCVYIPKNVLHNVICGRENGIEAIVALGGVNIESESL
jgi:mannose-6-phosphate isomerase-like protein (cupin superfamily)